MMLLHADGSHQTVTVRATATTMGGLPVVLVGGAAFVVEEAVNTVIHRACGDTKRAPIEVGRVEE